MRAAEAEEDSSKPTSSQTALAQPIATLPKTPPTYSNSPSQG